MNVPVNLVLAVLAAVVFAAAPARAGNGHADAGEFSALPDEPTSVVALRGRYASMSGRLQQDSEASAALQRLQARLEGVGRWHELDRDALKAVVEDHAIVVAALGLPKDQLLTCKVERRSARERAERMCWTRKDPRELARKSRDTARDVTLHSPAVN